MNFSFSSDPKTLYFKTKESIEKVGFGERYSKNLVFFKPSFLEFFEKYKKFDFCEKWEVFLRNFETLENLEIRFSNLSSLKLKDDLPFKHLVFLSLPGNKITILDGLQFSNFPMIQRINLAANQITSLENIDKIKYLKSINLAANLLTYLPEEILNLSISKIDVRFNKLGKSGIKEDKTSEVVTKLFQKGAKVSLDTETIDTLLTQLPEEDKIRISLFGIGRASEIFQKKVNFSFTQKKIEGKTCSFFTARFEIQKSLENAVFVDEKSTVTLKRLGCDGEYSFSFIIAKESEIKDGALEILCYRRHPLPKGTYCCYFDLTFMTEGEVFSTDLIEIVKVNNECDEGKRKILFCGGCGVGKSTLINGLVHNNNILDHPCVCGNTFDGVTLEPSAHSFIVNFPDEEDNKTHLIDVHLCDYQGFGDGSKFVTGDNQLVQKLHYFLSENTVNTIFVVSEAKKVSEKLNVEFIERLSCILEGDLSKCYLIINKCDEIFENIIGSVEKPNSLEKQLENFLLILKKEEQVNHYVKRLKDLITKFRGVIFGSLKKGNEKWEEMFGKKKKLLFLKTIRENVYKELKMNGDVIFTPPLKDLLGVTARLFFGESKNRQIINFSQKPVITQSINEVGCKGCLICEKKK